MAVEFNEMTPKATKIWKQN